MTIYLASGNAHKAREFQELANQSPAPRPARGPEPARGELVEAVERASRLLQVEIISAAAIGGMPPVVEDTGLFAGNARKKARALQERLPAGAWALADDSGLCVDALGGAPGVESAYYAGPRASGAENLAKLVAVMRDVPDGRRAAHFVCMLILVGPGGEEHVFEGRGDGRLGREPAGGAGFGYDPLFIPDGYERTFAELDPAIKNRLSHRGRAWACLAAWLRENAQAQGGFMQL
jgi:XTP/dITP diphosphohydrolase